MNVYGLDRIFATEMFDKFAPASVNTAVIPLIMPGYQAVLPSYTGSALSFHFALHKGDYPCLWSSNVDIINWILSDYDDYTSFDLHYCQAQLVSASFWMLAT